MAVAIGAHRTQTLDHRVTQIAYVAILCLVDDAENHYMNHYIKTFAQKVMH